MTNRTITPEHGLKARLLEVYYRAKRVYDAGNYAHWVVSIMYPEALMPERPAAIEQKPHLQLIQGEGEAVSEISATPVKPVLVDMNPLGGRAVETTIAAQEQLVARAERIAEARRNVLAA